MLPAPALQTGVVGCAILGVYSVGRVLFFFLREDEVYKSNRCCVQGPWGHVLYILPARCNSGSLPTANR
jgi:hypothetical protein